MLRGKTMKCYKKGRIVVYFEDEVSSVHYVPNRNWFLYLLHRKGIPKLTRICDTIIQAEDELGMGAVI